MSYLTSVSTAPGRIAPAPSRLFKFLAVGVVGLVVDLGLFWALERLGLPMAGARAISLPIATLITWLLNRRHTFQSSGRKPHHEALRYFGVAAVAQSVNYVVALLASALLHGSPQLTSLALLMLPRLPHVLDLSAAFAGSVVATLFSYTGQRFFTFAASKADATV